MLDWKFLIRRAAQKHGFLDPIVILEQLRRFTQPSEVAEPIELLRAGVQMHARGLINSRVIQHNLDWVWPYWVERQFDPRDPSFVPRAFSITHINLTHRNWTAIGLPDRPQLPIVDPRGLLTPFTDEWSLDAWVVTDAGAALLPSREQQAQQRLVMGDTLLVETRTAAHGCQLLNRAMVYDEEGQAHCRLHLAASSEDSGWLVVALRPYNPEGISFLYRLALTEDRRRWHFDSYYECRFSDAVDRHHVSDYRHGDVYLHLHDRDDESQGECSVGMLSGAALFRLQANTPREIRVEIPLHKQKTGKSYGGAPSMGWHAYLDGVCRLQIPDKRFQQLYDAALYTLVLHSVDEVYAGPYTYRRFWFRDAAFIIHALLCAGMVERAERALDGFPTRQKTSGYFYSQDGEWDSNGEALWIMRRYCQLTGTKAKPAWRQSVQRGGQWIVKKRLSQDSGLAHAGLLPAGFSAEHLGPNDYYYWDDFWGVAGLQAAAALARDYGDHAVAESFLAEARSLADAIDRSLASTPLKRVNLAMPASPYRRMDAGAIGSLAAGYPLQLFAGDDARLLDTANFLLDRCLVRGGFFQDMIHSGVNAYLTLHVAQVLLRAGDPRYFDLMSSVAELASATQQWPEAVHPHTGGGCMGDGQHAWAAAEWLLMLRNCFVREENDRLVLLSGVPKQWLQGGECLRFGPALTEFGKLSIGIEPRVAERPSSGWFVTWQAEWHATQPVIDIRMPGFVAMEVQAGQTSVELTPLEVA